MTAAFPASIEAANKAKELEAWKRRKNYDPLKSVQKNKSPNHTAGAPPRVGNPKHGESHFNSLDGDTYSEDTLSEDARSSTSGHHVTGRTAQHHQHQQVWALNLGGFFGSIFHDKIKHISKRGTRGLGPPSFGTTKRSVYSTNATVKVNYRLLKKK